MGVQEELLRLDIATAGNKDVEALSKSLSDLAKAGKITEDELHGLVDEFAKLAEQRTAVTGLAKLKATLQETGDNLFLAKRGLADFNAQFDVTDRSSAKVSKAFREAEKAVTDLTARQKDAEVALLRTQGTFAKYGLDINNVDAAERALAEQTKQANIALGEAVAKYQQAGAGAADLEDKTSKAGKAFKAARDGVNDFVGGLLRVTGISAGVAAALGALNIGRFFGGAVDSARSFEAALSEVRAVSGATSAQLDRMKAAAEAATSTTKFTAVEAANALGELARASGDADAAIKQLPATLALAQAAGIGAADAANILTTTLTQFGLGAEQAGRAADLFSREANSTQDTVTSLGLAMSYTAPLARQLGLSLEQTTAILGALAEQGFRGERAGTALRNVFSQLLDPASNFSQALFGLGINTKDFGEVITQLAAKGEKGKQALLSLDSEARPAIQALVTSGGAGIRRLTEDFKNAAGESQRTAKIMGDNFEAASSRLGNAFDALRRALVDPILEPLKVEFDAAAAKIRDFVKTADFDRIKTAIKDFVLSSVASIRQFAASFNFERASKSIAEFVENAKSTVAGLGVAFNVVAGIVSAAVNAIAIPINALKAVFNETAALIASAIGTIILSLSKLESARAFVTFGETAENARKSAEALKNEANAFFDTAIDRQEEAAKSLSNIGDNIAGIGEGLVRVGTATDQITNDLKELASELPDANAQVTKFTDALGVVPDYADAAGAGVRRLSDDLTANISGYQEVVKAANAAAAAQNDHVNALKDAADAVTTARRALELLAQSGDSNAEAFQAAQHAYDAAVAKLDALRGKAKQAATSTDELTKAYTALGLTAPAQLQKAADAAETGFETLQKQFDQGKISQQAFAEAFDSLAEKQLALAAASDEATKQRIVAELRAQAALVGTGSQLDELIAKYLAVGGAGRDASGHLSDVGDRGTRGLKGVQDQADKTAESIKGTGKAADKAAEEAQKFAERGVGSLAAVAQASIAWTAEFAKTSDAAAELFGTVIDGLSKTRVAFNTEQALGQFGELLGDAAEIVQSKIDIQRKALDGVITSLGDYGKAGESAFKQVGVSAEQTVSQLEGEIEQIKRGRSEFNLLGKEDLSRLQQALEDARQRVQALEEQAKQATESLVELARSTKDQIDQIKGNDDAVEQRRHEDALRRINEQAKTAGAAGAAAAAEATNEENELHALKMRNIAAEKKARDGSDGSGSSPPPAPAPSAPNDGGGGTGTGGGASASGPGGINMQDLVDAIASRLQPNITMHVAGSVIGGSKDDIARAFFDLVKPEFDRDARLRR